MDKNPFKIGIAGLGTVGTGIIDVYQKNIREINKKAGREIILMAVSAQNKNRDRGVVLTDFHWEDNPLSLAERNDIDLIVEVIGGSDGAAKTLIERALQNRKHIVTANKALIAKHGVYLAELAEHKGVNLRFEAAVAGAIPIVKSILESLSSNTIHKILGVMNGTCNYILTRMEQTGKSYEEVFAEADSLGYVEADPTLDVGGIDAAQKLAILSAIAFQTAVDFDNVEVDGIEKISLVDIENAKSMGYRIKLLGISQQTEGGVHQEVEPCLVPRSSAIAKLEGGTNMVVVDSDFVGQVSFTGPGAGAGPTASAIWSDIIDVVRENKNLPFGISTKYLKNIDKALTDIRNCYYLRFTLEDKPGVLAKVAAILGNNEISIDRMRQTAHDGNEAPLLIVTHNTSRDKISKAIVEIKHLDVCLNTPVAIKIEEV